MIAAVDLLPLIPPTHRLLGFVADEGRIFVKAVRDGDELPELFELALNRTGQARNSEPNDFLPL